MSSAPAKDSPNIMSASTATLDRICREEARSAVSSLFKRLRHEVEEDGGCGVTMLDLSRRVAEEVAAVLREEAVRRRLDFETDKVKFEDDDSSDGDVDDDGEVEGGGGKGRGSKLLISLRDLAKSKKRGKFGGLFHKQHSDEVELSTANGGEHIQDEERESISPSVSGIGGGARPKVKTGKVPVDVIKEGSVKVMRSTEEEGRKDEMRPRWERCRLVLVRTVAGCMMEFYVPPKV